MVADVKKTRKGQKMKKIYIFSLLKTIEINQEAIIMETIKAEHQSSILNTKYKGCKIIVEKVDNEKLRLLLKDLPKPIMACLITGDK